MMKRYLPLILLSITTVVANAQVRIKLNYNKKWEITTPDSAVYVRDCMYDTTKAFFSGPVTDSFLNGKPQMTGTYADKVRQGEFTSHFENGAIESVGKFENNKRVGTWKYFYDNGKLKQEIEFFSNEDAPKVITLNAPDGTRMIEKGNGHWQELIQSANGEVIAITGQYRNYLKDGHWKQQGPGENYTLDEWFKDGKFVRGTSTTNRLKSETFYSRDSSLPIPDKFLITEQFTAAPGITIDNYPDLKWMSCNGLTITKPRKPQEEADTDSDKIFVILDESPTPKTGMSDFYRFIAMTINYPAEARRKKIQGSVFVEFIVTKQGTVSSYKVIKGIGGGCDEEAVRVLKAYSDASGWIPGKEQGKPQNARLVLPIRFGLGK